MFCLPKLLIAECWFCVVVKEFLPDFLQPSEEPPDLYPIKKQIKATGSKAYHLMEEKFAIKDERFYAVVILMRLVYSKVFLEMNFMDLGHRRYLYGLIHQLFHSEPGLKEQANRDFQAQSEIKDVDFFESTVINEREMWVVENLYFKFILQSLSTYKNFTEELTLNDPFAEKRKYLGKKISVRPFLSILVKMSEEVMSDHGVTNFKFPIDLWE